MKQAVSGQSWCAFFDTVLGHLFIAGGMGGLLCVTTRAGAREFLTATPCTENPGQFVREISALKQYALGNPAALDHLSWRSGVRGTPFQEKVWKVLGSIPTGQTKSYGEVARLVGRPNAARAVGGACNANPLLLLVPCHRVVGADGSLTGYGEGLGLKKKLLALEKNCAA